MKIVTTCIFHCENEEEYLEALAAIDNELDDIEAMNEMCADKMTMKVTEDKDNLKITTVGTYTR